MVRGQNSKWIRGVVVAVTVLFLGAFVNTSGASAATGNWDGAKKAVINAYRSIR